MRTRSSLELEGKVKPTVRKKLLKSLKLNRLEREANNLQITVAELKRRNAHDIEKQSRERQTRKKTRFIAGASSIAA